MPLLRRLLFLPLSAVVATVVGLAWPFTSWTYSRHSLFRSIVGLAPLFFGHLVPIVLFVTLGTLLAPRPGRTTVAILGFLGGLFGWPFGPSYELWGGDMVFYLTAGTGSLAGAALGMLIAFHLARRKKTPNPLPEPPHSLPTAS